MECLKDFILSKGLCNEQESKSGLYIEQLEGISIKNIAAIEDGKYDSAKALIQEKVEFAGNLVFNEARKFLDAKVIGNETMASASVGVIRKSGLNYYDEEAGNRGISICKRRTPLSKIKIDTVSGISNTTATGVVITIEDSETKKTFTTDMVAGERFYIDVDYTSDNDKVLIYWDTTNIEAAVTWLEGSHYNYGCGHCMNNDPFLHIRGYNDGKDSQGTFGLTANIRLICDLDLALCRLSKDLAYPILYKAGILILQEWLASTEVNFLTVHSQDWAENKIKEWEQIDYKTTFKVASKKITDYITSLDRHCFQKNTYRYGFIRP